MKSKKLFVIAPAIMVMSALVGCGGGGGGGGTEPTLESISAATNNQFFYKETIKKSDIKVTATYSDKTTKDLTDFTVEGISDKGYTFDEDDINVDKTFKVTASGKSYDLKVNAGVRFDVETVEKSSKNYYRIINQNENSKGKIYVPSKMKIDNVECEFNAVGKTGTGAIDNVFKDNTEITEIYFTSFKGSGSEIASGSFQGCTNLTVCDLGGYSSGLQSIGSNAFRDTAIKEIIIPEACTDIGSEAFRGCSDLKAVSLGEAETEANSLYYSEDDINGLLENAETIYTPEGTKTKIEAATDSYIAEYYEGEEGQEVKWTLKK